MLKFYYKRHIREYQWKSIIRRCATHAYFGNGRIGPNIERFHRALKARLTKEVR